MKVNKIDILKVLNLLRPGLSKKDLIEQAAHYVFSLDEVATFSDKICIIHPFKCDFSFSVKGEEFIKILGGITEAEFDLTLEDNTVKIKCKSTKAGLSTIVGEESKVEHLIAALKRETSATDFFKPLPKDFLDGVYLCAFSANKDIATGVRACVAIKDEFIYSTDGIRVSAYTMEGSVNEMLIPAKDIMELAKYAVTEYGISENWVHFRTKDGIIFNCKQLKGDYPYKMVCSIIEEDASTLSFPAELRNAVASAVVLAEGDMDINKMVTIVVQKGIITVKAEKERGWIEKSVDTTYDGESFTFLVNPIFFNQILQHAAGFTLFPGKAQFESDNFFHVMALPEVG